MWRHDRSGAGRSRSGWSAAVTENGLRKAELEMAKSLVENLSAEFDPGRYDDTYRSELLELIQSKAEGAPLPEQREEEAQVVDLMQALRESVERTQKARGSRKAS